METFGGAIVGVFSLAVFGVSFFVEVLEAVAAGVFALAVVLGSSLIYLVFAAAVGAVVFDDAAVAVFLIGAAAFKGDFFFAALFFSVLSGVVFLVVAITNSPHIKDAFRSSPVFAGLPRRREDSKPKPYNGFLRVFATTRVFRSNKSIIRNSANPMLFRKKQGDSFTFIKTLAREKITLSAGN